MSSLAHHGVKGQKWGVRRYQNPDGTRTAEGKRQLKASRLKRTNEDVRDIYKSLSDQKQFDDATKQVLSKTSTNVRSITKEPADIHGVIDRARCSEKDARTCIKLADRIYEKAASVEPQITQDIIGIVNKSNSSMYGLEHRLKQPTSMAGKIGSDSKSDGVSFVEAANGIKDAVRYTTVSDNKSFVSDYRQLKSGLESKGYEEVKCKNFFEKYRAGEVQHKAVQTTFKSPTGYEFELQFQTPESQAAKDLKIPIYEERRKQGISSSRAKELEKQMHDLAERVPYPDGIETIESHNKVKHSSIGGNMNYIYGNTLVLGDSSYLEHHGIKNQKWGVRRFQNPDGSLTAAGRIRYGVTGAAKAAFKVGKKLGSATASAARAGVKKAKENAYAKKKEKVSQTREGVLKNKKMFTADELKALENRFKIEDEMSEASLRHGQAVAKTVSQYANTTRDVLSAFQTGGNAVSAITKAFADIQSYQNAKGVAEAAKEKGMTTKEFDLFLKEKYPNAKKDDGSKKKDKNRNKAEHSDSDDDNDDNNPPNDGGGGGAGSKKQAEYAANRQKAQEAIYAKRKADLDARESGAKQREDYLNKRQDALVKVSKQRQSEQDARDEDLNRRYKAASEREEKLKSTAKDAAEVMNKLKERKNNLDRREADLNNIADALDSEIGYRIDTISELRKTLHDDDDSSKKKKNAKHSAIGEEIYVDYLEHFGVHGMKWGVRRYQNPDGTLTDKGRKHYQKKLDIEERKLTSAKADRGRYERVRGPLSAAIGAGAAIVGAIGGFVAGGPAGAAYGAAIVGAFCGSTTYAEYTVKGMVAGIGAGSSKKKIAKYKAKLQQDGFMIQNGVLIYGFDKSNELEHFGIKNMKWGVRRFQNKDGSLTEAGKQRYANTGNLNSGGGGGGGAPEEEDEETKKAIEEAAKKAGMTVDEYRKKFAGKVAALKEKARDAAWDARYAAEDAADAVTGKTSKQIAEKSAKSAEENEKKAAAARKEGRDEDAAKYEEWAKQAREISEYRQGKYEKSLAGRYDRAKSSIAKRIPGRKAVGASSVGKSLTANGTVTAKLVKIKKKSTVNSRKDTSWKYDSSISTKDMRRMAKDSSKFTESVSKKAHEAARAQNSALRAGNKKRANTNSWAATQYNTLAKDEQTGGRYSVKNVKRNYDNTLEGKATKLKYATQRTKQRVYNAAKRKKKSASHAAFIEDGTLYLEHHGIKGQKWGLRRFQNPDGTRTEAGKKRDAKIAAKAAKYRNKDISRYDLEIAKAKDPDQKYRYEQLKKHTEKLSDKEIIAQQKHSRAVAAGEGIVATVAVSLGLGMPNIGSIAIGAAVAESIAKTTRDNYRVRSINAERMQESVHKEYENLINHSAFIEDGTLYLAHHGILGQKWGVRRFQDAAGRLTAAGKKRIKDAKSKLGNAGAKYKATSVENTESVVAPGGGAADDWDDFDEETLDIYIQNMLSLSDEDLALLGLKRSDLENAKSKDDKYKIVLALKKYDNPTAKGKRVLNSLMNAMFSSNLLATLSPVTLTGGALWAKMREAAAERRKAREPVDPKTGLHLKQEWDKAPEFDVVNVNPGFTNLSDNTKNNCMLCTTAYDLRRRGYDVNAERISQGLDYNDVKRYYPDAEVRNITNASTTKELNKKTRAALISQGEGARGNLMVQWQGGAGGHSMAYEVHDGDVKIYDAQTGAVKSTEDVIQYTVSVSYARLDNVEPDWDRIKEAVR